MMQLKWFKIEVEADGTIRSCTEVDNKARSGATVRYIEGTSAADACAKVKAWVKHRRDVQNAAQTRRGAERVAAGLCKRCGRGPLATTLVCEKCRVQQNAERRLRNGGYRAPGGRGRLPDEEFMRRQLESGRKRSSRIHEKWGSAIGYRAGCDLKFLDEHGASAIRERLCARIRKAGGGEALDAYEAERPRRRNAHGVTVLRYEQEAAE